MHVDDNRHSEHRARAAQVDVLTELDRAQVTTIDGARTLAEWVTGRLDVSPETGRALAYAARSESRVLQTELEAGEVTLDRVVATRRLVNAGADTETLAIAAGVAVNQVHRLVTRQVEMSSGEEAAIYQTRALWAQPNLANTAWNLRGRLAATDGEQVFKALEDTADALSSASDPWRPTLVQRRADALVSWAMNHLDPRGADRAGPAESKRLAASLHLDATLVQKTSGKAGIVTRRGVKAGPNTLSELLCAGEATAYMVEEGMVKTVDVTKGDRIPKPIRDYVWDRDGGCVADGCTSRYRLEIHHIRQRDNGGDHHPDNLTVMCWFHHHVVIHGRKFTIDPASPPGRRRFLPRAPDRDPPDP
jgi:hypothetical protein